VYRRNRTASVSGNVPEYHRRSPIHESQGARQVKGGGAAATPPWWSAANKLSRDYLDGVLQFGTRSGRAVDVADALFCPSNKK